MNLNPTTDDQDEAFAQAAELVREDAAEGRIEADVAGRGIAAGDVPRGEIVRVLAEAYTGDLDYES
ncbi:hypothetical protein OSG_eHP32_00010 [environmental Halophage eHP-32]|nr:hypothetical protein OSG_eHP32_00010 [environmental Halophage eHP-32]